MAQVRHNYKLLFGERKDGVFTRIVSSHYESVPMMIVDVKAYLKEYHNVSIHLRGMDLKICTLDGDGNVFWNMSHQEYREAVTDLKRWWNQRADLWEKSPHNNDSAMQEIKDMRYYANVYPELLMIEYRTLRAEFSK
jgi:hypothetical protein